MSTATAAPRSTGGPTFVRSDKVIVLGSLLMIVLAGIAHYGGWNAVLAFVVAGAAVVPPGLARRARGGAAGRPVRTGRDRRAPVGTGQPA